jgi:hypothetical protein
VIGEDTGGWTSPYRDPGDHYAYPDARQEALREAELVQAYRNAAQDDLEPLGPPTGVPVAIHGELRELRALVDVMARQLETQRELLELLASILGVELVDDQDDDALAEARDAVDAETSSWTTDGRAGWQ